MKLPYTIKQIKSFINSYNNEFIKKVLQPNVSIYEKLANANIFKINEYQIIKNKYKEQEQWYITKTLDISKNIKYYNFSNNIFEKLVPDQKQNPDNYYSQDIFSCFQIIKNIQKEP